MDGWSGLTFAGAGLVGDAGSLVSLLGCAAGAGSDGLSITEAGADRAGDGAAGADAAGAVDSDCGAVGVAFGAGACGVDLDGGASGGLLELAAASRLAGPGWAPEASPGTSIMAVGAP